jgi:hypothetical protein
MTHTTPATTKGLIACSSCGRDMSVDADACPACGGPNSWVHPTLGKVITHLNTLPRATRFEARGHRMAMQCSHQTPRQVFGSLMMMLGMVCLIVGIFFGPLLMVGILSICIGGLLTLFGLSATTRHELTLDLRVPGIVVGTCDTAFWRDVLEIVRASQGQTAPGPKPPTEPPMWT